MRGHDSIDMIGARQFHVIPRLSEVDPIEVFDQTQAGKWVFVFFWQSQFGSCDIMHLHGSRFLVACWRKVINLSQHVCGFAFALCVAHGFVMSGGSELWWFSHHSLVGVCFP